MVRRTIFEVAYLQYIKQRRSTQIQFKSSFGTVRCIQLDKSRCYYSSYHIRKFQQVTIGQSQLFRAVRDKIKKVINLCWVQFTSLYLWRFDLLTRFIKKSVFFASSILNFVRPGIKVNNSDFGWSQTKIESICCLVYHEFASS